MKSEMKDYLLAFVKLRRAAGESKRKDLIYEDYQEFVVKTGKYKRASKSPSDKVVMGKKKECFMNATNLALRNNWQYVEGWAVGFWITNASCLG